MAAASVRVLSCALAHRQAAITSLGDCNVAGQMRTVISADKENNDAVNSE